MPEQCSCHSLLVHQGTAACDSGTLLSGVNGVCSRGTGSCYCLCETVPPAGIHCTLSFIRSISHSYAQSVSHSLVRSSVRSFVRSLARSLVHSFIHACIHSFAHALTHSHIHPHTLTQSLAHSHMHSHSLNYSLTHSTLTQSPPHSLSFFLRVR